MKNYILIAIIFLLLGGGIVFYFYLEDENKKYTQKDFFSESEKKKIEGKEFLKETERQEEKDKEKKKEEESKIEAENISSEVAIVRESLPNQSINCSYKIEGIPSPKGVAFSPDNSEVWATSLMNEKSGLFVYDIKTGDIKENIKLPNGGGVEIIFSKDGKRAFVSQMETGRVYEIDAKKKEVLRSFDTKSAWTKVMAISSKEDYLYASNWSGNNVSVINLESGLLKENIPTVQTPRGIYVTKDGNYLYVAGFNNGEIQKINLSTKESEVIYRNGGAMRHIVGDEEKGFLYISDMANARIYRVNIINDKVEIFVKTENNPNTITLSPDKNILAVSCRGANNPQSYHIPGPEWGSVLFFDTESGEMVDTLIGGNQTTGLDIAKNGIYLAYSDFLDARLTLCNLPSTNDFLEGEGGASSSYKERIRK